MFGFADYSYGAICSPGDTHKPTPESATRKKKLMSPLLIHPRTSIETAAPPKCMDSRVAQTGS